jgi:hypothetical protein
MHISKRNLEQHLQAYKLTGGNLDDVSSAFSKIGAKAYSKLMSGGMLGAPVLPAQYFNPSAPGTFVSEFPSHYSSEATVDATRLALPDTFPSQIVGGCGLKNKLVTNKEIAKMCGGGAKAKRASAYINQVLDNAFLDLARSVKNKDRLIGKSHLEKMLRKYK